MQQLNAHAPATPGAAPAKSLLVQGYEVVIGFETHAQLSTRSKIFSRASTAFGAEPNTQACAVDLALPGTLPVMNKGAVERAIRFGLAVGLAHRRAQRVRAQELLLPRPAQGLPDQPVRDPGGAGREHRIQPRWRAAFGAPGAGASGRGRRQVAARGLRRPDRHRPQPRRHAAAGDRHRTRHAFVGRSRGLRARAAPPGDLDRHLRRQHAGRQFPLRCQRVGAQARCGAGHAARDQEPEQLQVHAAGDRLRGALADRADRGRARDRAGHGVVRPRDRRDTVHAHQGRRCRLPLLPRSGPAAAGDRSAMDSRGSRQRCRSCRAR